MSEGEYTPGPWVVRKYPTGRYGVVEFWVLDSTPDVDGKVVANAICKTIETNSHSDANARLIASAPQLAADLTRVTAERDRLREACEAVAARIDQLQEQWGKEGFTDGTVRMLREALKPAT